MRNLSKYKYLFIDFTDELRDLRDRNWTARSEPRKGSNCGNNGWNFLNSSNFNCLYGKVLIMNNTVPFRKIGVIFLSFWFVPLILIFFSMFMATGNSIGQGNQQEETFGLWDIFLRNAKVYAAILLVGLFHKVLPYIIYYYNSVVFSFYLGISIGSMGVAPAVLRMLPYGILEIFAFSIITYIGSNIKETKIKRTETMYFIVGGLMLFAAAYIESSIIYKLSL